MSNAFFVWLVSSISRYFWELMRNFASYPIRKVEKRQLIGTGS
jgi:hypothetical protein